MKRYGYVYLTIDTLKGYSYVGQHKSNEYDKTYFGSGTIIKNIIKKRKDTLRNYVLEWCGTKEELNEAEINWIALFKEECGERCLNIAKGGVNNGGHKWNPIGELNPMFGKHHTEKTKSKMKGRTCSQHTRNKISTFKKEYYKNHEAWNKGKKQEKTTGDLNPAKRPEVRAKISKSNVGNTATKGRVWMNNGIERKMIKPEQINEYLLIGWKIGWKFDKIN